MAGVITRFREESVVIMGDIEAMFHQVLVPEKYRSQPVKIFVVGRSQHQQQYSRFWDGCTVFGGTSSPSCCNYAMKRKAMDNEEKYLKKPTDTLRRNFYVDDLLKSVRDVNTAICLLHEVIKLCAEGGLRLTKFVSNKVEVFQSIPESDRRDGLKNISIVVLICIWEGTWDQLGYWEWQAWF